MKFIEITTTNGKRLINCSHITDIIEYEDKSCRIYVIDSRTITPKETYLQVKHLILR